jgi:two-component system, NtrC family, response regulator HydG
MANILIIEDDITFSNTLKAYLHKHGHTAEVFHSIKEGIKNLKQKTYQLILLDFRLPDGSGTDVLHHIQANGNKIPVIIMTSFNDVRTAVNSIKMGAHDYITKPVVPEELLMIINNSLQSKKTNTPPVKTNEFIEGSSEKSRRLIELIEIVAPTSISVLLQGESGTGKEQIARIIHKLSERSSETFVAIDCGALSPELAASELFGHEIGAFTGAVTEKKGQFEVANGGTFFLDEIGNLSYEVQVKLLRVLQERIVVPVGSVKKIEVDIRLIAASNEDLALAVKNGNFREDLYHRLNEFKIDVPPLRQRLEDMKTFIDHFIKLSNLELGKQVDHVSEELMQIFLKYSWPGNLRELKNIIKRSVLLAKGNVIDSSVLPEEFIKTSITHPNQSEFDLKAVQETNEKEMIIKTLHEVRFNKSKAARLLNIDRKTLYIKLAKYNIAD